MKGASNIMTILPIAIMLSILGLSFLNFLHNNDSATQVIVRGSNCNNVVSNDMHDFLVSKCDRMTFLSSENLTNDVLSKFIKTQGNAVGFINKDAPMHCSAWIGCNYNITVSDSVTVTHGCSITIERVNGSIEHITCE